MSSNFYLLRISSPIQHGARPLRPRVSHACRVPTVPACRQRGKVSQGVVRETCSSASVGDVPSVHGAAGGPGRDALQSQGREGLRSMRVIPPAGMHNRLVRIVITGLDKYGRLYTRVNRRRRGRLQCRCGSISRWRAQHRQGRCGLGQDAAPHARHDRRRRPRRQCRSALARRLIQRAAGALVRNAAPPAQTRAEARARAPVRGRRPAEIERHNDTRVSRRHERVRDVRRLVAGRPAADRPAPSLTRRHPPRARGLDPRLALAVADGVVYAGGRGADGRATPSWRSARE